MRKAGRKKSKDQIKKKLRHVEEMATADGSKYSDVYHLVVTRPFLPKEGMDCEIMSGCEEGHRHGQSGKLIAFMRSWKIGWACTRLIAGAGDLEVREKERVGAGIVCDTFHSHLHALLLRCPNSQEQLLSRARAQLSWVLSVLASRTQFAQKSCLSARFSGYLFLHA